MHLSQATHASRLVRGSQSYRVQVAPGQACSFFFFFGFLSFRSRSSPCITLVDPYSIHISANEHEISSRLVPRTRGKISNLDRRGYRGKGCFDCPKARDPVAVGHVTSAIGIWRNLGSRTPATLVYSASGRGCRRFHPDMAEGCTYRYVQRGLGRGTNQRLDFRPQNPTVSIGGNAFSTQ